MIVFTVFGAIVCVPQAFGETREEAFDGSFRLTTGEVITGGLFVEAGQSRFLFMDTENLARGGLFERAGDQLLRSIVPPGVEIEFIKRDGGIDGLVWREKGRDPIAGRRVYPHRSRPVRMTSADGTELRGRLMLPACTGPHPVIVSVHGSGPVNRYGGPYHTFFLQQGMAVLAYDKRGYTTNSEAWREPDLASLSADVATAVRFAAEQPEIDADRIGIAGSSQAGWVVPRAAVEAKQTSFMILRAGAALTQLETVLHEIRQELRSDGLSGLDLDHSMELRREIYMLAIAGKPISAADALVAPYLDEPWYRTAFGVGPVSSRWSSHWWDWAGRNLSVASAPDVAKFEGAVLWFLAELDENVPLVSTRAALEGALHSFLIPSPDGPPRFSPGYFDRMKGWLEERKFSDRKCFAGQMMRK